MASNERRVIIRNYRNITSDINSPSAYNTGSGVNSGDLRPKFKRPDQVSVRQNYTAYCY
jgi:hypothetical protein